MTSWDYREGGKLDSDEAIIIITGIFESTNTPFLIVPELIRLGYRVITISIPSYHKLSEFLCGFDFFTARMRISKVHIIGIDLGGFLALHLASFKQLSAEIKSLTVISSYMNTTLFKRRHGLFSNSGSKSTLLGDLTEIQFPPHLRPAVQFLRKEVENMNPNLISARCMLRNTSSPVSSPSLPEGSILVVQSLDFSYKLRDEAVPHKMIKGAKVALMKQGGNFPHLVAPSDLLVYINLHLSRWSSVQVIQKTVSDEEN